MIVLMIIALGFAPAIFWLYIFYRWDRYEPEPIKMIIRIFLLGMLAAIPAAIVEAPFIGYAFVVLVIVGPIVEELIKFSVVYFGIYHNEEFDEPMDGIVYAAAAALGFAAVENPLYLLGTYYSSQESLAVPQNGFDINAVGSIFFLRAMLAVPGHAIWSSMWGYALGRAKFMQGPRVKVMVAGGLLIAMVFHGLHNLLAAYGASFALIGLVILAALIWLMVRRLADKALDASPFKPSQAVPQHQDSENMEEKRNSQ